MSPRSRDLALAATWLAADQATKLWAAATLDAPVTVVPGLLRLWLSHNTGALFGIMADWPDGARFVLLTLLPLVAIAVISVLLVRTPPGDRYARVGLALILGGATGNVLDRIVRGHVIDFIDAYCAFEPLSGLLIEAFGTNRWPTFNIADAGLTCGAALLLYEVLRRRGAHGSEQRASLPDRPR